MEHLNKFKPENLQENEFGQYHHPAELVVDAFSTDKRGKTFGDIFDFCVEYYNIKNWQPAPDHLACQARP